MEKGLKTTMKFTVILSKINLNGLWISIENIFAQIEVGEITYTPVKVQAFPSL